MKSLGLIILWIFSLLWGYFSWKYLNIDGLDSLTTIILLAWMFVFWVLFWKIPLMWKQTETVYEEQIEQEEDNYFSSSEDYITKIEPVTEVKEEKVQNKNTYAFSDFEDIQDDTLLNVANNRKKQDLKVIEGIGPKIEKLLNKWGIYSYNDLEQSNINNIKAILEKAWNRYMMHNPSTWKKQAWIAGSWDFEKLKSYQDKLNKWVEV